MGKKSMLKMPLSYLKKIQKKMMKLTKMKKQTMYNILILLVVFGLLYFVKTYYLTTEGFECGADKLPENISQNDKVLVLFYADWCGHCKKFLPEWDTMAKEYNNADNLSTTVEGENMDDALNNALQQVSSGSSSASNGGGAGSGKKMMKLNCGDVKNEEHVKIMKKYNIQGYPTIIEIKKNGEFSEYEGGRDKKSIFDFLNM